MSERHNCGKVDFYMRSVGGCIWQLPETAPKDRQILADMGYPWPMVVCYSPADQSWSGAELESSLHQGADEFYFVTERFSQDEMLGWMDLPAVMPRAAK